MLYQVKYDSVDYWVEAASFAKAVEVWTDYVKDQWGPDFDGTEQPDSVALITDDPVIREQEAP